jgi:hypothetical protein
MFALKGGISQTQSPSELILNRKLDFNAHCKVEFGEYVQTHKEHDNSMGACTVGAIATRPTGNTQGGYYFIALDTGRRINRRDWTSLPMPTVVVDQVHRLARRAKAHPNLAFTNLRNEDIDILYQMIPDDDDDDDAVPPAQGPPAGVGVADQADEDNDDGTYHPGDTKEDDEDTVGNDENTVNNDNNTY